MLAQLYYNLSSSDQYIFIYFYLFISIYLILSYLILFYFSIFLQFQSILKKNNLFSLTYDLFLRTELIPLPRIELGCQTQKVRMLSITLQRPAFLVNILKRVFVYSIVNLFRRTKNHITPTENRTRMSDLEGLHVIHYIIGA